jgi:hypothetical protein
VEVQEVHIHADLAWVREKLYIFIASENPLSLDPNKEALMKAVFLIALVVLQVLVSEKFAFASGCGRNDFYRTVEKNEHVEDVIPIDQFELVEKTDSTRRIREKATGREYTLAWESSELYEDTFISERIEKRDLLYEEGDGCGPVFRCVTGQYLLRISDPKKRRTEVFTFPTVNEISTYSNLNPYVSGQLLPTFGTMKLDTPSLVELKDDLDPNIDHVQCGYGVW